MNFKKCRKRERLPFKSTSKRPPLDYHLSDPIVSVLFFIYAKAKSK